MKFTAIVALFALASGVTAYGRQDAMRNLARSLIEEYEDFLAEREEFEATLEGRAGGCVARNPSKYKGMKCSVLSCQSYCRPSGASGRCGWSSSRPDSCSKCKCQKE